MMQAPDYTNAAVKATETLIRYGVSFAPIDPLRILKTIPGAMVLSFAEMADKMGLERKNVIGFFGPYGKDATTTAMMLNGKLRYLVGYNQRLPFYLLQRGLARELGHIILGHDGSKPEDVRTAEAVTFAQHFLCPRALIKQLEQSGVLLTVEVIGNVTGCYDRCLSRMSKAPGVCVPAELNRKVKNLFADYVENFVDINSVLQTDDESMIANFGTYMDGYEE